ncbi:hypothetical protein ACLOJK_038941 [Asimina triloba]
MPRTYTDCGILAEHRYGAPPSSTKAWIRPPQNDAIVDPAFLRHVSPNGSDNAVIPIVSTTSSSSSSTDPSCRTAIAQIRVIHYVRDIELTFDSPLLSAAASQGELVSSVVDDPASIMLRLSPFSNLDATISNFHFYDQSQRLRSKHGSTTRQPQAIFSSNPSGRGSSPNPSVSSTRRDDHSTLLTIILDRPPATTARCHHQQLRPGRHPLLPLLSTMPTPLVSSTTHVKRSCRQQCWHDNISVARCQRRHADDRPSSIDGVVIATMSSRNYSTVILLLCSGHHEGVALAAARVELPGNAAAAATK